MRILVAFATLLVACAQRADTVGTSDDGGTGGYTKGLVHADYVGLISAVNSGTYDWFDIVNLGPISEPGTASCDGGKVVGSCCWFPPSGPVADPGPSDAGVQPESSAGTVTLVDSTTEASGGSFTYDGQFYEALPTQYSSNLWHAGDVLTLSAAGGKTDAASGYLDAFTAHATVLQAPTLGLPSPLTLANGVTVTWQPDANATTMIVNMLDQLDGGSVSCVVPDAQATVTIDASLFATFKSGDPVQIVGDQEMQTSTATSSGTIVFESDGWTSIIATVE